MRQVLSRINPGPRIRRLLGALRYYGRGIVRLWGDIEIFLMAQAIAFKALVTIVPVLILLTGILAWVLARDQPFARVAQLIHDFLPPYQSEQLIGFLQQLQMAWGTFTLVGAVALFITIVTLFSTLRRSITLIFHSHWREERSFFGQYLFDARMAVQVGVFFLLTIAVTVGFQIVDRIGAELIAEYGLDYFWVEEGWKTTFQLISVMLPLVITMAMFFQLYYFIPKPSPPVRSVLLGAVIAGLLWEVVKLGFTWYASYLGRFERYIGDDGGIGPIGEAFGLIIFFVFWVYYSGIVFLLGAFFTLLDEERLRGKQREPSTDTEIAPPEPARAAHEHSHQQNVGESTR